MSPHDNPEGSSQNPRLSFSDCREGGVLVSARGEMLNTGFDFYLIITLDKQARRVQVRSIDGSEFWMPWWSFDQHITQQQAEALGAQWRVAPQERPKLIGPARHPPKLNKE